MARISSYLLALLFISTSVSAIPVEPRQLGGIGCNVARLKTVAGLRQATKAVGKLAASDDPAVADAAATAQGGLSDASAGIKTIAAALVSGQDAPADARDQVGQGLTTAQTALSGITAADADVADMVADAQAKVEKTISAGGDVVAKCGGGGGAAAADAAAADATADDATAADATAADATAADATAADATAADATAAAAPSQAAAATGANDNTGTGNANVAQANTGAGRNSNRLQQIKGNNRVLNNRQIGGIGCNVARLQTVSRLAQSSAAVNKVKTAAAGDADATAAATEAGAALQSAKGAIGKIAAAIVTGQQAPAAERDKTEQGLNDAMAALNGITSTDSAVTSAVTAAKAKVASTIQAGQGVVSKC